MSTRAVTGPPPPPYPSTPSVDLPAPDATLPTGTDLAVRVRGLCKSYRTAGGTAAPGTGGRSRDAGLRRAVDDLALDVGRGEIVALLGPNGAGKSTTTEILEGYRHRDSGEVAVLGTDPWQAPLSWRARVGIVLQDSSAAPDLTVKELLSHWARLFPDPRPANEVADLVGLGGRYRARIPSLSGGQRRRLDVALAIVGRPEVLFLDEPTTGFDPEARHQFWGVVEDLRDEGSTILLTTHYLDEAARLADRVAVVADGRLVACAPPDELGGPLRDVAVVRWRDADGTAHARSTTRPTALLRRLLADRAAEESATDGTDELADLRVERASLEDVYLQLLGHRAAGGTAPTTTEEVTS